MISLPPAGTHLHNRFLNYQGLTCFIENPKGSMRYGTGWATKAPAHYGYILGFMGADGDEMDCYIGPNLSAAQVYVIDQNVIGSEDFDEHKCMLGYFSQQEALTDYMDGHNRAREIFRGMTAMTIHEFYRWLRFGNHKVPVSE